MEFNFTMKQFYLDDKNEPVEVKDLLEWASNPRSHVPVDRTEIGKAVVSTIFLGLSDIFGNPVFETMIFGGPLDMYQERCRTWAQALEQHAEAVSLHNESLELRRIKE